jgi:hypothetical protein
VGKEVGEREETRVHRRRRISPGKPADARNSDEQFLDLDDVSGREGKGGGGGGLWLFIAKVA